MVTRERDAFALGCAATRTAAYAEQTTGVERNYDNKINLSERQDTGHVPSVIRLAKRGADSSNPTVNSKHQKRRAPTAAARYTVGGGHQATGSPPSREVARNVKAPRASKSSAIKKATKGAVFSLEPTW